MGMYTELHFNSRLKTGTPADVISTLQYMLGENDGYTVENSHPLFTCRRFSCMLMSDSYYFDADTVSTLRHDDTGGDYLCIRCNLKNYEGEIEKFLNWIHPYLDKHDGDFLGFMRYEETEDPSLIYYSTAGCVLRNLDAVEVAKR